MIKNHTLCNLKNPWQLPRIFLLTTFLCALLALHCHASQNSSSTEKAPATTATKVAISSPGITAQDFAIYATLRKVADLVFVAQQAINTSQALAFEIQFPADFRAINTINPLYDRTTSGLFLEFSVDFPSALHTPWGRWAFNLQRAILHRKNYTPNDFDQLSANPSIPDGPDGIANPTLLKQTSLIYHAFFTQLQKYMTLEFDPIASQPYQPVFKITHLGQQKLPEAEHTQAIIATCLSPIGTTLHASDESAIRNKWNTMQQLYETTTLKK